jgi:hypothetical protein
MSLAGLLNQTVQVRRRTGTSYTGDPTYGDPVTHPARISYKPRRILSSTGIERSSYAHITVEVEVGDADLVILPDGVERIPLQVSRIYGGGGVFHHTGIDV